MIKINNLNKNFDDFESVKNVRFEVEKGTVCGLVGTNGAGKSTVLRMISGIIKQDSGAITICGEEVYENVSAKEQIFHLQDKAYFISNDSLLETAKFYATVYKNFDIEKVLKFNEYFGLDIKKSLKSFSKGMQRQASIMLALAANTEILLLDESFDGLDPMHRKTVKKLIVEELMSRNLTVVVTSQNLYDLDGLCDQIVLLHKGNMITNKTVDEAKEAATKFQVGFDEEPTAKQFKGIKVQNLKVVGRVASFVALGNFEKTLGIIESMNPLFVETVSLSLEEIFIIEVEYYTEQTGNKVDCDEIFQVTSQTEV